MLQNVVIPTVIRRSEFDSKFMTILGLRSTGTQREWGKIPVWGMILLLTVSLFGCATVRKLPPGPPLSDREAAHILQLMQEQGGRISSFYALGQVVAGDWYGQSDADILTVGIREPFRLKIEITHSWGQPLLHILIDGKKVEALSFRENRLYVGTFTPQALSRFIPAGLDADLIWGALRGYPSLLPYQDFKSLGAYQINLFDGKGEEVETIDLYRGQVLPETVTYPGRNIRVVYSEFHEEDGVSYAGEVKLGHLDGGKTLVLKYKKMAINPAIPKDIFVIKKPPSTEIIDINRAGWEKTP